MKIMLWVQYATKILHLSFNLHVNVLLNIQTLNNYFNNIQLFSI